MDARLNAALAAVEDEAIRSLAASPQTSVAIAPRATNVLTAHEPRAAAEGATAVSVSEEKADGDGGHRPPLQAEPSDGGASEGVPESESVNVWPDDTAESAFMAEARGRGESPKAAPQVIEEIEDRESAKALPKLDEIVQRIPAETRELLDELFRAKFVAVRRVKKSDLKV